MKNKRSFALKFIFLILIISLNAEPLFAAKKKKKSKNEQTEPVQTQTVSVEDDANSIKVPSSSKKQRTYFSKIDAAIVEGVENGSYSSICTAMELLRKNEVELTENEKVLIYVATEMTNILWNSQKVVWNVYDVSDETAYKGALNSVKKGIYDTSTGNTDFLSTFLPSLVLLTPNISANVQSQCEKGILDSLELNPQSVAANYLAGVYYNKVAQYQKAQDYLKRAYEAESSSIEIALEYSRVLSKNGNIELAQTVVNSVAPKESTNLLVLKQNAYIAFESGDMSSAEDYVARVLQQTPNDLEFVLFRAKIFIEKNDYIHAVSLLDMYARQDDKNLDYLILRARVQLDWSKNTTAATETIEKALQLYPNNNDALMIAARISSATDSPVAGKYADELAQIVLQNEPTNINALSYALDGLVQRENWQEAYEVGKKLINDRPDPEVVLKYVTVCLELGKKSEANEVAQKAYQADSGNEILIQSYILASTEVLSREDSLKLIESMMNSSSSKIKSYLYYRKSFLERNEETSLADLRSSLIANPRNSDALFRLYEIYYSKKDYRKAQYYLRQVVAINPNDNSMKQLNEALTQLVQ